MIRESDEELWRPGEGEVHDDGLGKALTLVEASNCLTCVGPTFRLENESKTFAYPSFAFIAMEVMGRHLQSLNMDRNMKPSSYTDINKSNIAVVPEFIHVIYLDLTNNRLTDISLKPLGDMQQLKALVIDKNLVESVASVPELNQLQLLSVKENCLTTCEVRELGNLLYLDMSYNTINVILPYLWCPYILPKLRELSMRGNELKKLAGFLFSNLVSLFLAENQITTIEGLELLPNLKFLHLRKNPLATLDGFSAENKKLFYINLRDCNIEKLEEFRKLKVVPRLERIVVRGNPFWNAENSRLKLIGILPRLRRINKKIVDEFERQEVTEMGFDVEDNDENEIEESDAD